MMTLLTCLQIEEVKGVTQVIDEAEKVSEAEFAKFEEKLLGKKASGTQEAMAN